MKLTAVERQTFIEVLQNPPEPNAALLSATKRYFEWLGANSLITDVSIQS